MRLIDILRANTSDEIGQPSIKVTVDTNFCSYKGILSKDYSYYGLVEKSGFTTIEFNQDGVIEKSRMMKSRKGVKEVIVQIRTPEGYYDLRNSTEGICLSDVSVFDGTFRFLGLTRDQILFASRTFKVFKLSDGEGNWYYISVHWAGAGYGSGGKAFILNSVLPGKYRVEDTTFVASYATMVMTKDKGLIPITEFDGACPYARAKPFTIGDMDF